MLIYEVNLLVDATVAVAYRAWLREHVAQMLALPGFVSAEVFDVREPAAADGVCLCVQYRLRDAQALQDYLRDHAAAMRADGLVRFGDRFTATRRILQPSDAG
ncbi:MAG: DUF4286 family protein [Pseudoxanthomonas suwonensis]|nr:DUF4286 family protein [Pseudoxanthomonas suwonensis]